MKQIPNPINYVMQNCYRGIVLLLLLCFSPLLMAQQANLQPSQIQLNNLSLDQLQQAAEAGDPDAQYALGYMYYYGKNVPRNTATALNWIKRAAVQGQSQAINAMRLLGQSAPQPSGLQSENDEPAADVAINTAATSKKIAGNSHNYLASATTAATDAAAEPATTQLPDNAQPTSKTTTGRYYTIQLLGTSNKAQMDSYIKTNNLQGKAQYTQNKYKGKTWYSLTYGKYRTRTEAQAALTTLPTAVRAKKPFIKTMDNAKPQSGGNSTKHKSSSKKSVKTHQDEALSF